MSAAEPADHPARPYVNTPGAGSVIDITKRRRGGALQAAQGRWTMATPPTPPEHGPGTETGLALFADDIETTFNAMSPRRTLTDDDTVAVYRKTLDIWQRVLEGSHAQGVIDSGQLAELGKILNGMRQVPDLV